MKELVLLKLNIKTLGELINRLQHINKEIKK